MLRKKEEALIISFQTTTEAMKMDHYCTEKGLPGRLIPIPRQITAGCGMCWKAKPEDKDILEAEMKSAEIFYEYIYVLAI